MLFLFCLLAWKDIQCAVLCLHVSGVINLKKTTKTNKQKNNMTNLWSSTYCTFKVKICLNHAPCRQWALKKDNLPLLFFLLHVNQLSLPASVCMVTHILQSILIYTFNIELVVGFTASSPQNEIKAKKRCYTDNFIDSWFHEFGLWVLTAVRAFEWDAFLMSGGSYVKYSKHPQGLSTQMKWTFSWNVKSVYIYDVADCEIS